MIVHLGAFVALSLLLAVVPGPDMVLVARNALRAGRRGGTATAFGTVTGLAVWTLASSVGLAALLRASEPAFVALKLVGAAYLAYLGGRALLDARRHAHPVRDAERDERGPLRARTALRQGVLSNLGNPKIAVFFTGFLPQFVRGGGSPFLALLTLGFLFCALTLAWLVVYSALVARAGDLLRHGPVRRAVDALTGLVLLAFGGRLALERRG